MMLYRGDFLRPATKGGSEIGRTALIVAQEELKAGAREIGGNNTGDFVKKYMGETKYNGLSPENRAWCASFVSYCFTEAAKRLSVPPPFPYQYGARGIFNWAKNKRLAFTEHLPQPGDIVAWWREDPNSWQAHVGIVYGCTNDWLYTIEGNHTSEVKGFSYPLEERMMAGLRVYNDPNMKKILAFISIPDYIRSENV